MTVRELADAIPLPVGRMTATDTFDFTEATLASEFVASNLDRLRFDHQRGAWFRFTGSIWCMDATAGVTDEVRTFLDRERRKQGVQPGEFERLGRAKTVSAVLGLARADQRIASISSAWDEDQWHLGTPAGTVDLRTGALRQSRPGDLITKATAVVPVDAADCPLWLAFLDQATGGDTALTRFLQQWGGYCLTGSTREQSLLFIHGAGGNGKGVFLGVLQHVLGDYARTAGMEVFAASRTERHSTELARLAGARLVTASETDEGRAWAEARIKALTGGDVITARFMRQDDFEYTPAFKLTIIGNHKPALRAVDDAMRRRLNIVPFNNRPARRDHDLDAKLRAEAPGILRWLIDGCLDWQINGLIRPASVLEATSEYFEDQNAAQRWLEERCDTDSAIASDTTETLFASWREWAMANGEEPGDAKALTQTLARLGFERVTHTPGARGKRGFRGVTVVRHAASHWTDDAA